MALNVNGTAMERVIVNGKDMDVVKVNGVIVWESIKKVLVSDGNIMVDSGWMTVTGGWRANDPNWGINDYNYGIDGGDGQAVNQTWTFNSKYNGKRMRLKCILFTANRSGEAYNGWYIGDTKMGQHTHHNGNLVTVEFTMTSALSLRLNALCRDGSSEGGYQRTRIGINSLEVID